MSGMLESVTAIAMAGALVQTYEFKIHDSNKNNPKINMLLVQLDIAVERTILLWEYVDPKYYARIEKKINKMKEISILGKPDYIITFIDFVVAILENLLDYIKFERYCAVKNIIEIVLQLRWELLCNEDNITIDEFKCAQDAIICSEQWRSISI